MKIKKYLAIFSGIVLLTSLAVFVGLAMAEENHSESEVMSISPIIKDIPEKYLKQELSIKEIPGRVVCMGIGVCPPSLPSTEVLIKAAKVTEIGADYLKISIFNYVYKIDISGSKIVRYEWNKSAIDEFSIGDIVNIHGYLDASDNYLVNAKTVRNVSIQKVHSVFRGIIKTIDATSMTFIIATEEAGDQMVAVNNDTKIIKQMDIVCITTPCLPIYTTGSFGDLQVGIRVTVRGLWNKTLAKIQARVIIIGDAPFLLKTNEEKISGKEKEQKEEHKEFKKEQKEELKEIKKSDTGGMISKILDIQNQLKGLMEKLDKIKEEKAE